MGLRPPTRRFILVDRFCDFREDRIEGGQLLRDDIREYETASFDFEHGQTIEGRRIVESVSTIAEFEDIEILDDADMIRNGCSLAQESIEAFERVCSIQVEGLESTVAPRRARTRMRAARDEAIFGDDSKPKGLIVFGVLGTELEGFVAAFTIVEESSQADPRWAASTLRWLIPTKWVSRSSKTRSARVESSA